MALGRGSRLGSYEVLSLVAGGGMGEVYAAVDPRLDRRVALKILPPSVAATPEQRDRFQREAKTLAALSHPNIVVCILVVAVATTWRVSLALRRRRVGLVQFPK